MSSNLPQFTVRIELEHLKKLRYIAEYNGRSANGEVKVLIKNHIKHFEKENGIISIDDLEK